MTISTEHMALLLDMQRAEVTEHLLYNKLARVTVHDGNRRILEAIAKDEARHAGIIQEITKTSVAPSIARVWGYYLLARVLGLTFALRLMERGEGGAQETYREIGRRWPELARIEAEEHEHEQQLLGMLDEERLKYVSSVVLGLNDALVELTGVIAGMTLALRDAKLIALVGLVTGISAALSMAASEYLATKEEDGGKDPIRASLYTGTAYMFAVAVLVAPFLLLSSVAGAMSLTLLGALLIILGFTFYNSVARGADFRKSYLEMAAISLGVAGLSFGIGLVMREFLGVEV